MKKNLLLIAALALGGVAIGRAAPTKPSLYERMGGIHKIAAFVDMAYDWELEDEALLMNPTFQAKATSFPTPAAKFLISGYLAAKTGGPQTYSGPDIPSIDKGLNLSRDQRAQSWKIRLMAMEKAGIDEATRKDFMKWYDGELKKAKPMMIPASEPFQNPNSLYARLGGIAPISMVVNDFVNLLATDPTIGANPNTVKSLTSGKVSGSGLKYLVTEQLGAASGGPWKYSGKAMAESHKGLMITENEWKVAAGLLKKVLDGYKVPEKEQGEIFTVIQSTHKDIVGK